MHLRGDLYTIAALDGQTRSHLQVWLRLMLLPAGLARACSFAAKWQGQPCSAAQGVIAEETAGSHARCILAMGHNKGWSEAASSFTVGCS